MFGNSIMQNEEKSDVYEAPFGLQNTGNLGVELESYFWDTGSGLSRLNSQPSQIQFIVFSLVC